MGKNPYNEAVRRHFAKPLHAGDLQPRYAGEVTEACESRAGLTVSLKVQTENGIIRRAGFRVFGCPHLVAAAEELCRRLEGRTPEALEDVPVHQLMSLFEVPVEKTGRLLLLEDAAHALRRAILAGEPSGA